MSAITVCAADRWQGRAWLGDTEISNRCFEIHFDGEKPIAAVVYLDDHHGQPRRDASGDIARFTIEGHLRCELRPRAYSGRPFKGSAEILGG